MARSKEKKLVAALKCGNPRCKKTHTNKRFCSRACSVTVTNREVPRRPRKNYCLGCSALIKAGQVYCQRCKDGGNGQLSLDLHTSLKFTTLAGKVAEEPLNPISLTGRYVFRCQGPGTSVLATLTTCGQLIGALMALCSSQPEFLTSAAVRRHLTFLDELRHLELRPILGANFPDTLEQAPVKLLNVVLEPWVMNYLRPPARPLFARYAMDTARLLVRLVNGETGKLPEPWELEPVLKGFDCDLRLRRDLLGLNLRKAVYGAVFEVEALVPEGCEVRGRERTYFGPSDYVRLVAGRDTEPAADPDIEELHIEPRAAKPRFDIAPDLVVVGLVNVNQANMDRSHDGRSNTLPAIADLLNVARVSDGQAADGSPVKLHGEDNSGSAAQGLRLALPWWWITGEMVVSNPGEPACPVQVPRWSFPENGIRSGETLPPAS